MSLFPRYWLHRCVIIFEISDIVYDFVCFQGNFQAESISKRLSELKVVFFCLLCIQSLSCCYYGVAVIIFIGQNG